MYFSKKEQPIIETFYKNLPNITTKDVLELKWKTGSIKAVFDTCFDDFDEENERDEYTSFVFKGLSFDGKPPVQISDEKVFVINYHNFPESIMLLGETNDSAINIAAMVKNN